MDTNQDKKSNDREEVISRIMDVLLKDDLHAFVFCAVTKNENGYYEHHESSDAFQVPVLLNLSETWWQLEPKEVE